MKKAKVYPVSIPNGDRHYLEPGSIGFRAGGVGFNPQWG